MRVSFSFFRFFVTKVFIIYLFLSLVALGDEYKVDRYFWKSMVTKKESLKLN